MVLAQLNALPLDKTKIDKLVQELCDEVLLRVRPIQLILFGSAARLEMTEYSDLDILVVVELEGEIRACARALRGVSCSLNWPVDILVVDKKQFEIKRERGGVFYDAWNFGKTVFERENI